MTPAEYLLARGWKSNPERPRSWLDPRSTRVARWVIEERAEAEQIDLDAALRDHVDRRRAPLGVEDPWRAFYPRGFTRSGIRATFTMEEAKACAAEHVPPGDHSCGCDGATDDGCAWCDDEKARAWIERRRAGPSTFRKHRVDDSDSGAAMADALGEASCFSCGQLADGGACPGRRP